MHAPGQDLEEVDEFQVIPEKFLGKRKQTKKQTNRQGKNRKADFRRTCSFFFVLTSWMKSEVLSAKVALTCMMLSM